MIDISGGLSFLETLFIDSFREIRFDFSLNILKKYPIFVIINPDFYNPPFITNLYRLLKQTEVAPVAKTSIHVLCLFLDILYGFLRLLVSLLICGFFTFFQALVISWIVVVILYRWESVNFTRLIDWWLIT